MRHSFSYRITSILVATVFSLLLLSSCTWTTLRPHIIASSLLDLKAKGLLLESDEFDQKMEQITGSRRHPHNQLMLLKNGEEIFRLMLALIETAQESVFIDQYAFHDDETGSKIARALKKRAQEGIEVRIVYDSVGSRKTSRSFWKDLKSHRIKVRPFNPIHWWTVIRANNRNHRKIIIIDREIAIIGDFGIGNQYRGDGYSLGTWQVSAVLIRGPATRDLVNVFFKSWEEAGRGIIKKDLPIPVIGTRWHDLALFTKSEMNPVTLPALPAKDGKSVRVMSSTPNWGSTEILDAFLFAVQSAKETIHITQSYFIPNSRVRKAFIAAARRGVKVKIMLPERSDVMLTKSAGEIFYEELLDEGIRIFERQGTMLHTKVMVIDGIWSTLGSSNIDDRSFLLNYECNVTVSDKVFGEAMEGMFTGDLMDCREINLKRWKKRPWWKRFKTRLLTPIIKQL
jgi:cardiolipin synthase